MICCFAEGKIGIRPLFDGANQRNQCVREAYVVTIIILVVQIRLPQKYDDGFGIESNSRSGRHCLRLVKDNLRTARRERGREGISSFTNPGNFSILGGREIAKIKASKLAV